MYVASSLLPKDIRLISALGWYNVISVRNGNGTYDLPQVIVPSFKLSSPNCDLKGEMSIGILSIVDNDTTKREGLAENTGIDKKKEVNH